LPIYFLIRNNPLGLKGDRILAKRRSPDRKKGDRLEYHNRIVSTKPLFKANSGGASQFGLKGEFIPLSPPSSNKKISLFSLRCIKKSSLFSLSS
jgi:hypothetical protein